MLNPGPTALRRVFMRPAQGFSLRRAFAANARIAQIRIAR